MIALAVDKKAISLICQSGYELRDSPSAECQTEQHPFCDYSFRKIVFCSAQVETPYTCSSIVFKLLMLRSETNVPVLRMSVHVLYRDGSSYQTWGEQRIHVISCIYIFSSGPTNSRTLPVFHKSWVQLGASFLQLGANVAQKQMEPSCSGCAS